MTAIQAFLQGDLSESLSVQQDLALAMPSDENEQLNWVMLLSCAGLFEDALIHLRSIASEDREWPETQKTYGRLLQALRRRDREEMPSVPTLSVPNHATLRMKAIRALRDHLAQAASRFIDRADAVTPELRGFVDGRPFVGIRDADDRFASVLEAISRRDWVWFPWEMIRRVRIKSASSLLDHMLRPALILTVTGVEYDVRLPLIYPGSYLGDSAFATGMETDHVCPDDGPVRCIGAKLIHCGDEELLLKDCQMIEIKP